MSIERKDEYDHDPSAGKFNHEKGQVFWDAHDYDLKWGMSIDLSSCTGCGACMTACQEENNIPVVGKQGMLEGREMHWMRIDRYFVLPRAGKNEAFDESRGEFYDDPMVDDIPYEEFARRDPDTMSDMRAINQPMLCQHCERAPCETVCPVSATTHSEDGLNQMTYNRCVGTRYCANNCPYKVRRFNWFNYSSDRRDSMASKVTPELDEHGRLNVAEPLPMSLNPDVTVRSRGVMEKCTFCVQRIRRAKWQKKEENREHFDEDDVKTACEEACPAGAIEFGAIVQKGADEEHQVRKDHESPRSLEALSVLNTNPSVAYLTDVRNTKQRTARSQGDHGGGHGGGDHGGKKGGHGGDSHGGSGSHGGGEHG
ncbi:MAG: 4Fe-4S dicluster domain-containing protein, partial [Bradymonadaceae bacterium]